MSVLTLMYIIGCIGVVLFMVSCIPDTIKAIRVSEMKGVTVSSSVILLFALVTAITTNVYFGNYPFVLNDLVCIGFTIVILVNRIKKLK